MIFVFHFCFSKINILFDVQEGHLEIVEFLIAKGANTKMKTNGERSALWIASKVCNGCVFVYVFLSCNILFQNGHLKVVEFLVGNGAKVDRADERDQTPLSIASRV